MNEPRDGGFTLIELIITCVVIATMFLAIFGLFNTLRVINARANNLTIANEAAQQQMESIRNLPYAAIPLGTVDTTAQLSVYPQLGTSRSSSTSVTSADSRGLKKLDVVVNYDDRGIAKKLKVSTLIALNGIDR